MSGSQYHFKRFCRSVSRPLLQQFIAKVAPTLKVDWGTVLVKNVDTFIMHSLNLIRKRIIDWICSATKFTMFLKTPPLL